MNYIDTLYCCHCGKPFVSKAAPSKLHSYKKYGKKYYCSEECRLAAQGHKKILETKCANCGKIFTPSGNHHKHAKSSNKFCCSSCSVTYNNKIRKVSESSKEKRAKRLIARSYALCEMLQLPFGKALTKRIKNNEIDFTLVEEIKKTLTPDDLEKYMIRYSHDNKNNISNIKEIIYKTCPVCGKKFYKPGSDQITCSTKCGNKIISQKRIEKLLKDGISGNTGVGVYQYKNFAINCDSKLEVAAFKMLIDTYNPSSFKRCDFYLSYIAEDNIERKYQPDFIFEADNKRYIVEVKSVVKRRNTSYPRYGKNIPEKQKCLDEYGKNNNMIPLWVDMEKFPQLYHIYQDVLKEFKK